MKNRKTDDQAKQGCCLDFNDLEELCDDPKRNESRQEVHAVLTPSRAGFVLSVRDGSKAHKIVDRNGRQIRFKTVELARERISDIPYLQTENLLLDGPRAVL